MLNILNVAQTGLLTAKTQVENVMNNLANEHTDGYKTRTVNVSELSHSDSRLTGRGVTVDSVSRTTDNYMYQNLVREEGRLTNLTELNSMLGGIEAIFDETDTSGMSADLNRYFTAVENLRTSPENEIYKNDMKTSAEEVINNLKGKYSDIEQQESLLLEDAKETIDKVNNILNSIGDISKEILNSSGTSNDLLDKRDALEIELAKYVDVDISRDSTYELKLGGQLAVRFDTNVHEIKLVEEYSPQKDIYTKLDEDGFTDYDVNGEPISNLINTSTWNGTGSTSETQTLTISGAATSQVSFLGTSVTSAISGRSATDVASDIAGQADIITNWNKNNPEREITSITAVGDSLTITYNNTEGDVGYIPNTTSNGINFAQSVETQKGFADSVTYSLNNSDIVKVSFGEYVMDDTDGDGTDEQIDINNDGIVDASDKVDETNVIKALVYKINSDNDIGGTVTAYNGQYEVAEDGSKILTNNPLHSKYDSVNPNKDRYLVVESAVDGEKGSFVGEILVTDDSNPASVKSHININANDSKIGIDDIHLEVFDNEIYLSGGSLNSMLNNIKTESGNNLFNEYKDKLDQFAKTLVDMTSSYIENADQTYVFGADAVEVNSDSDKKIEISLFEGADVKTLTFNESIINTLTQDKLDYLAQIQWKEDVDFDGTGENNSSFSKFYQEIRVQISDDRENIIFKQESQSAVTESIQNSYDKLTKVDKDAEMIDLIKYQSAYEANAKMITVMDEMLQTLLGLKR